MSRLILMMIALLICFAGNVSAETESPWSGSGELGYLQTTGNSETESINARAGFKYENDCLLGEVHLTALYSSEETEVDGRTEDRTSAEKYTAMAKTGYKFSDLDYVFLNADYEDDRFSGYEYRSNVAAGYGRKLVHTDTVNLNIEAGPGYRYDKPENGERVKETLFRGYVLFKYVFSPGVSFQQEVTVLADSKNTATKSVTALKSKIKGALSMKVSYKVEHDSHVPADTDKTDTETAVTLVYDF